MPGFDGTGPLGRGPMSGRGRGFCALRIPAKLWEPVTGYAGCAGWPVLVPAEGMVAELAVLRNQVLELETVLDDFKLHIGRLSWVKSAC